MIKFIYGSYGCGKTTEVFRMIENDTKRGIPAFLIIPDQEAVQFERLSLEKLEYSSQLHLEILSFSRLYNRVCREYGGLSYSYITKPMRSLMMWKTLHDLKPILESYSNISSTDMGACDSLISLINEMKANGINPAHMEIASKKLPLDDELGKRLRDIALIYSSYDHFISSSYSDSSDDLQRLCSLLSEHDFFRGANVYIDSFSSYTGVQHKIIEQIFKSAENTVITFPLSSPNYYDISTDGICTSHKKLISAAQSIGGFDCLVLEENKRARHDALSYLSRNLWKIDTEENPPEFDGSIVCEVCENRYTEAEAVAAHITKLLRDGERCRDIVVIARDVEKYKGILDTALAKSNIPYFLAEKTDLCSQPAIKLILCALRIKKYNWQRKDVIAYIKTGLCGISREEACLFEEYTDTWNINGSLFTQDTWTMNPDGFVASLSDRGRKILEAANKARKKLVEPLTELFVRLEAAPLIVDKAYAVNDFICSCGLEEKLGELAEGYAKRGDIKEARELLRVYEIIISALSDLIDAFENEEASTEEFAELLQNLFEKTEIGSIPTSIDEVVFGSAAMLRSSNPKYAFAVGLCEGEFPANVKDTGLLSSNDRASLLELGIELSGDSGTRSSDELMYARRAFSAPSEKLFVLTHTRELDGKACFPSLAFKRIEKLFKDIPIHSFKLSDLEYLTPSPKNALGIFRTLEESSERLSLGNALKESIDGFSPERECNSSTEECRVSQAAMQSVLPERMHFSATSFEKYASCPFGYFCSNVLKLRTQANDKFNASNMGSFVHYILEVLIKDAIPSDPDAPILDDDELIKRADAAVAEYLEKICPSERINSKKLAHLYSRLKKLALLLIRNTVNEFSKSKFRPAFFELRANGHGSSPAPLIFTLSDGACVEFGGVMDRVDIYRHEDAVYVRIVDYKTGAKTFSLGDIEHGINLQMLIYLFTLCRSSSPEFKASIGLNDGERALPAGVVYLSAAIPSIDAEDYTADTSEILKRVEDELVRSGLLLNEEEILLAMNSELDTRFLAKTKKSKSGELVGEALISSEGFAELFSQVEKTVIRLAEELRRGNADASPIEYGKESPCTYCDAKPICRKRR